MAGEFYLPVVALFGLPVTRRGSEYVFRVCSDLPAEKRTSYRHCRPCSRHDGSREPACLQIQARVSSLRLERRGIVSHGAGKK